MEFVDIDNTSDNSIVFSNIDTKSNKYIHSDTNKKSTIVLVEDPLEDIISIDKVPGASIEEEDVEHICIKEGCDASYYYGCPTEDGGFKKDNLFSELTDEYQRTLARINLGIADKYALKWGNITGNLSNQKDLYIFVTDSIAFNLNKLIDELNSKLSNYIQEIELKIKLKADIYSPEFTGTPTTTLPPITDDSNRIASTEWVNDRIEAATIDDNVKVMSIVPEYMCYGDPPVDVVVTWEYYKEVEEQFINDEPLAPEIRTYTFHGVNTSKNIILKYKYGETSATRILTFESKYPIFYGISDNYLECSKTVEKVFTVTAEESQFIYVFIPNGSDVSLMVNSIVGGFEYIGIQELYNNIYYIFKSYNSGLGETTVEIQTVNNVYIPSNNFKTLKELLDTKADSNDVYTKQEVLDKIEEIKEGNLELKNYYTKEEVNKLIPDTSIYALQESVPTKVSQLLNDSNYLTSIPSNYVTEEQLNRKGFLTEELEPAFKSSVASMITSDNIKYWNSKVDAKPGMGLSQESFTSLEKDKLSKLSNYDDSNIKLRLTTLEEEVENLKDNTNFPDLSDYALKESIPTKVSQLTNDSGYLTSIPENLVTLELLESKNYLTSYTESDPTVPEWAKAPTKPSYTLEELGAEQAGAETRAINSSKTFVESKISEILGSGSLEYPTLTDINKVISEQQSSIFNIEKILTTKADSTELFSRDYNDLINTPEIPSIAGLASETWVQELLNSTLSTTLSSYALKSEIPDITNKVDKIEGKGLSTNDYTNEDKAKLQGLSNFDSQYIEHRLTDLERNVSKLMSDSHIILETTIEDGGND